MAKKLNKEKRSNLIRARCCGPCMTFTMFGLVLVPLVVFFIAAVFALPLWGLECQQQAAAGLTPPPGQENDPCVFYEWWKYIMGNLVGLATPLTNVAPVSGHAVSEIIDLLICVWSLALAGVVIGSIAQLTFVALGVESVDKSVQKKLRVLVESLALDVKQAAAAGRLDLASFQALVSASDVPALAAMSEQRVATLFRDADADANGTIDQDEANGLVRKLRLEAESAESHEGGGGVGGGAGAASDPQVAQLAKTVALLAQSVEELHRKLDATAAKAGPPTALPPLGSVAS
jgi:hypothetical protein